MQRLNLPLAASQLNQRKQSIHPATRSNSITP
jgi:hypothetical protein